MVEIPSWRAGRGWEALPEDWEWSGGPAKGPGVVGRPTQRVGTGREAITEGR